MKTIGATFGRGTIDKHIQLAIIKLLDISTQGQDIEIEAQFMEKVNLLPTKFRSRFRKFDPKYLCKTK